MKKLVLIIGVMALSMSSFAASKKSQTHDLGDLIEIINNLKDALDKAKDRRNDRPGKGDKQKRLIVEKYSVPVERGQVLSGESVIGIKRALRRQGVQLDGKAIKSVTIRAKSQHGRARVALQVGRSDSRQKRIDGDRRSFEQRGRRTLHTVSLEAPVSVREQLSRGGVRGVVRLNIRGNVKLRSVEVEVVRRRRR